VLFRSHLIQQIRDETHRFAVTFHRKRRTRAHVRTALADIPGIGERTAQKLLREFGSVAQLRKRGFDEISRVVNKNQARSVVEYFLKNEDGAAGAENQR
jgi:excinuclease ABC subunit C